MVDTIIGLLIVLLLVYAIILWSCWPYNPIKEAFKKLKNHIKSKD